MILMGMGDNDSLHLIPVFPEIIHGRDDNIHPQHIFFREHKPGVNDKDDILIFNHHHIQANFAKAAQGNYFQHQDILNTKCECQAFQE